MASLDKTWQECSLDEDLQNFSKEFNSIKNSGCHGNKMAENGKSLLKSSCDKPLRPKAFIFCSKHHWVTPYQNFEIIPLGSYLGFARVHPILHRNKAGNL